MEYSTRSLTLEEHVPGDGSDPQAPAERTQSESMLLNKLPVELLDSIVSLLPRKDWCNLRLVCRGLEAATIHPFARIRYFSLAPKPLVRAMESCFKVLEREIFSNSVRELRISSTRGLFHCPRLTAAQVALSVAEEPKTVSAAIQLLTRLRILESLNLTYPPFSEQGLDSFLARSVESSQLHRLRTMRLQSIDIPSIDTLNTFLLSHKDTLRVIHFGEVSLWVEARSDSWVEVLELLLDQASLTTCESRGLSYSDESLRKQQLGPMYFRPLGEPVESRRISRTKPVVGYSGVTGYPGI